MRVGSRRQGGMMNKKNDRAGAVDFVFTLHLNQAREADKAGDYKKAGHEYRRCTNVLKHNNIVDDAVFTEYEDFVKRDPEFKKVASIVIAGIKENPAITMSDFFLGRAADTWGERYGLGRPLEPIDVRYFFDFAERLGYIVLEKVGNSDRIILSDELFDVE
jgi:hypothetical protein